MRKNSEFHHTITETQTNQRFDQVAAEIYSEYSRSQLQKWIKSGNLLLNGQSHKGKTKVSEGDIIDLTPVEQPQTEYQAEDIPLNIIHEDDAILVINKPDRLVVHPAVGNWGGTLVNGLLHHRPELKTLPRAGIVHRLDKNTSGLMVIAKTLQAHAHLVNQLQERTVKREYMALVQGSVISGATIETGMGRHPIDRKRMAVTENGKLAITHYRIAEKFGHHTLLRVNLETGRTHQIRVHMSWKQMPIVGDATYRGRLRTFKGINDTLKNELNHFPRQALHAIQLGLIHPTSGEFVQWKTDIPEDMQNLMASLRLHDPIN